MDTVKELKELIGKEGSFLIPGHLRSNDIQVNCRVLDVRKVYNRVDVLVTPLSGAGSAWIAWTSFKIGG